MAENSKIEWTDHLTITLPPDAAAALATLVERCGTSITEIVAASLVDTLMRMPWEPGEMGE